MASMNDWELLQRELERSRAESTARVDKPQRFAPNPGEWLTGLALEGIRDMVDDFSEFVTVRKGKFVPRKP